MILSQSQCYFYMEWNLYLRFVPSTPEIRGSTEKNKDKRENFHNRIGTKQNIMAFTNIIKKDIYFLMFSLLFLLQNLLKELRYDRCRYCIIKRTVVIWSLYVNTVIHCYVNTFSYVHVVASSLFITVIKEGHIMIVLYWLNLNVC